MKDSDLRGIVLRTLYESRGQEMSFGFADDAVPPNGISATEWIRICKQLNDHNLIEWEPLGVGGRAEINAFGVDIVEGTAASPIAVHIDQSQHITVSGSQSVQIAGANSHQQQTTDAFESIISAIATANIPEAAKKESQSLLLKILDTKAAAAVLGAGAQYLAGKLQSE